MEKNEETWCFEEYVKDLEGKNRRDFDIIVHYWEVKDFKFPSKEVSNSELKRCLRAAKLLKDYSDDRLVETMTWLKYNADFPWKLETVLKYINEDLTKLRKKYVKA